MKIRSDGLVCRVAYPFFVDYGNIPNQVSLCTLFWKFLFMLFVGWPVMLSILIGLSLIGFFFTWYASFNSHYGTSVIDFNPYKRWPTIMGFRILPIHLIIFYLLFFTSSGREFVVFIATVLFTGTLASLLMFGLCNLPGKFDFSNNEAINLVKEYAGAVKNKVCPIVEIKH